MTKQEIENLISKKKQERKEINAELIRLQEIKNDLFQEELINSYMKW